MTEATFWEMMDLKPVLKTDQEKMMTAVDVAGLLTLSLAPVGPLELSELQLVDLTDAEPQKRETPVKTIGAVLGQNYAIHVIQVRRWA